MTQRRYNNTRPVNLDDITKLVDAKANVLAAGCSDCNASQQVNVTDVLKSYARDLANLAEEGYQHGGGDKGRGVLAQIRNPKTFMRSLAPNPELELKGEMLFNTTVTSLISEGVMRSEVGDVVREMTAATMQFYYSITTRPAITIVPQNSGLTEAVASDVIESESCQRYGGGL